MWLLSSGKSDRSSLSGKNTPTHSFSKPTSKPSRPTSPVHRAACHVAYFALRYAALALYTQKGNPACSMAGGIRLFRSAAGDLLGRPTSGRRVRGRNRRLGVDAGPVVERRQR